MIDKLRRNFAVRLIPVFFVLLSACLFSGQIPPPAAYRSGPIEMRPEPDFGLKTDWNDLFYDTYCDLVEGPDGSLFVSSNRQHTIFKFDEKGRLIKQFGQHGQGPGDFNGPHGLSILDGKILVVGEYGLSHRISLFDLEGNFLKLLKTQNPADSPLALRDGKIAYVNRIVRRNEKKSQLDITAKVMIKDVGSGSEIEAAEEALTMHYEMYGQMMATGGLMDEGNLFLARDSECNLIVGSSLRPSLDVYGIDGTKIRQIPLEIESPVISKSYIRAFLAARISDIEKDRKLDREKKEELIKRMRDASLDYMIGRPRVGYDYLQTDKRGNILVFKITDCVNDCPTLIQIYSPGGEFIRETELIKGNFGLDLDFRWKTVCFSDEKLFALVELTDAAEYSLRLIKVRI